MTNTWGVTWGVEGVRLGLCHWAGLGLRWEEKTKQVNIMHIIIDDQLVSFVQLGTVQTATVRIPLVSLFFAFTFPI